MLADGIGHYFWNSAIITIIAVVAVTAIIPIAAYSLAKKMTRGKAYGLMYLFLILGIFVPFQVIMIPITVMMSKIGLANMWGLILLYLTYAVPQTLFLYVGFIKLNVPISLDEAAEIDGASHFTTYFKIVFPIMLLKTISLVMRMLYALWFWNDFMLPLLILNRDSNMWTLPLFQYNYTGQYFNDYGPSFASYTVGMITVMMSKIGLANMWGLILLNGAVK
ncbi:sugar ABC transporter permease (plasmid) [Enterococcus faecium]|nr:sugar ABC transporter permease [Enterococcus faecium]